MKNKGFTLVELIAVVVIMGMILLIVFPATSRLIRDNEEREYDTYYDIVQEGIELYARTKRDDIGGTNGTGCIDQAPYSPSLTYLIEEKYVKAFEGEKNVICKTPDEFSTEELTNLGIDTSKTYTSVRIENNKGKIDVEFSMICYKDGKRKPEYTHLIEKTKVCNRYVAEIDSSLVKEISSGSKKITSTLDSTTNQYYVDKNVTNNYVWYSGMMWRIISYNTQDKTIKMITDENITLLTYNISNNNNYRSYINLWLNNNFLNSLRNPEKYLLETEWNYTATSTTINPARTSVTSAKVGLLNYYEYCKIVNDGTSCTATAGFLNIGKNFWLLSNYISSGKVWYVDSTGTAKNGNVQNFIGVRPTVVLRQNITYIKGGEGTETNPYRLTGDTGANTETLLNTRYAGEYVKVNNINYRILSKDASYTKLVAVEPLSIEDTQFHFYDKIYSNNTYIGEYLFGNFSTAINDFLVEADFCRMKVTTETSLTARCQNSDILNTKMAVPQIGEMFTANTGKEYWTINNATDETIYVVEPDGTLREKTNEEKSGIRPVISIKNTVVIAGGNGTAANPYTIR